MVERARAIGQEPVPPVTPTVVHLDEETRAAIVAALEPTLQELTMAKVQKQVVFKHKVEALAGLTDHQRLPMLKTVKSITIHYPDGCDALVDMAVGYSQDKRLLPEEGYLALNDATPTWAINKDVGSDTLWVEIKNGDAANSHTISVIVNYEEA